MLGDTGTQVWAPFTTHTSKEDIVILPRHFYAMFGFETFIFMIYIVKIALRTEVWKLHKIRNMKGLPTDKENTSVGLQVLRFVKETRRQRTVFHQETLVQHAGTSPRGLLPT